MRRIVVIGAPGAGKSLLAQRLGRLLGIDVYHLDELYWRQSHPPHPDEWAALERHLVARERWIIDGNYSARLPARLDAADTAIFLDLPTTLCLARFVLRRLPGRRAPVGTAGGRRPAVSWSAIQGVVSFRTDHRPAFLELLSDYHDRLRMVILRTRADVARFLAEAAGSGVQG